MTTRFCFVCGRRASARFGVRARYGDKAHAHWAPDVGVYLCGDHAISGAEIEITYRATRTGKVNVRTQLADKELSVRAEHRIGAGTKRDDDDQAALW